MAGTSPSFNDEAVWPIARTPELEADLRTRHLQVVVFDAASDDPMRSIIGTAHVPLAGLAQGVPVEGAFKLTNPVTRKPAGRIVIGLGWHNPLQPAGAPPKGGWVGGGKAAGGTRLLALAHSSRPSQTHT